MTNRVFVFGASGHAKVVIDILERMQDLTVAFAVDDNPAICGQTLCGYPIIGGRTELLARRPAVDAAIVTIGDNAARCRVAAWLTESGIGLVSAIHPHAAISRTVILGGGTVVMAGCVINSDTTVGTNVIVNTGSTIDHDCAISDGVHLGPGTHLCGGVHVGAGSFLGVGSTVIVGIRIGAGVVVGAGSTVLENIPDGARVAGTPARLLRGI